MSILFAGFTSLVLSLLFMAAFLYVLFLVVRAAVDEGVRRALKDEYLRPWPPGK